MERIGKEVVDSAIQIHKALGPGLLESAYEACMVHELVSRGIHVSRQVPMPIHYRGSETGCRLQSGFVVREQRCC